MTTYYISSSGSDVAAGTSLGAAWLSAAPWNTLVAGVGVADGSELVIIGSLTVSTAINMPTNPTTVRGTSNDVRASITVTGSIDGIKIANSANGATVKWLDISGGANCVNFGQNCINCTVTYCSATNWRSHGIDGNGGTSQNGNSVSRCHLYSGVGDCFSVGDGSGWTLEYNNFHDTTGDSGTDGIAFHDSNAFKNIVRYNVIKNIAPGVGKAGISVGSTGVLVTGGSWVEAYGNTIVNCGIRGIACLPVGGAGHNPKGRLVAYNNVIVTSTAVQPTCQGIGVLATAESFAPQIFNNIVYNRYTYTKISDTDDLRPCSYGIDSSATSTVTPFLKNNISILSDTSNQLHWILTAQAASAITFNGDTTANTINNNMYWPPSSICFLVPGTGVYTLADVQSALIDTTSTEANPLIRSIAPMGAQDVRFDNRSPLVGAGADLSSFFTVDFNGLTRSVPWTIGPYGRTFPQTISLLGSG